jgi:hypothetical protein
MKLEKYGSWIVQKWRISVWGRVRTGKLHAKNIVQWENPVPGR